MQNDILKEYIARGTYIFPPKPSLRLITDVFKYCAESVPQWNTISISGYHMSEAGATAAQELAFTIANGIAYVDAALESGLGIDEFAPRLSFFFVAQKNFFEEVAKYRAARRIWARIMKERYGAKNPRSWPMRFHTQTAGVSLTAQQGREQRRAHHGAGARRRARRHAVAAHELYGRGAGPAPRTRRSPSRCAPSRYSPRSAASPTPSTPLAGS